MGFFSRLFNGIGNNPPVFYIDTSGCDLRQRTDLDIVGHKATVFKVNKQFNFIIGQVPLLHAMGIMKQFILYTNKLLEKGTTPEQYVLYYGLIVELLCRIGSWNIKGYFRKKKFRNVLSKRCIEDTGFGASLVEGVLNTYKCLEKQKSLIAKGTTGLMTYGRDFTWSSYKTGEKSGRSSIQPRY